MVTNPSTVPVTQAITVNNLFTSRTLTTPIISTITNTGTLTLPTSTDTLVGRATTDTLTNKTLTSPVFNTGISGTAIASTANVAAGSSNILVVTPASLANMIVNGSQYVDASVANPAGTVYAASAGTDPTVTLITGTKALVTISARINSAGNFNFLGFVVSGASTLVASDSNSAASNIIGYLTVSRTVLVTGLTAGSNTFTMQYRCNVSASGAYDERSLIVIGLP